MDERYENELQHWGIKGMKWGVRRYQNDDGSLTAAGRVRYGAGKARDKIGSAVKAGVQKHKAKVAAKKEEKRIEELMKKPIRKLSEAEMRERKDRAEKENALKQIEERNKQAAMSFMAKFGNKMVNDVMVPAVVTAGKNVATKFLEKAFTKATGLDAPDLTNTYKLFKKAGFNTRDLTDAQIDALEARIKKENTIYQQNSNIERQQKNRNSDGGNDRQTHNVVNNQVTATRSTNNGSSDNRSNDQQNQQNQQRQQGQNNQQNQQNQNPDDDRKKKKK